MIPDLLALSDGMGTGWFAAVAADLQPGIPVAVVGDGAICPGVIDTEMIDRLVDEVDGVRDASCYKSPSAASAPSTRSPARCCGSIPPTPRSRSATPSSSTAAKPSSTATRHGSITAPT